MTSTRRGSVASGMKAGAWLPHSIAAGHARCHISNSRSSYPLYRTARRICRRPVFSLLIVHERGRKSKGRHSTTKHSRYTNADSLFSIQRQFGEEGQEAERVETCSSPRTTLVRISCSVPSVHDPVSGMIPYSQNSRTSPSLSSPLSCISTVVRGGLYDAHDACRFCHASRDIVGLLGPAPAKAAGKKHCLQPGIVGSRDVRVVIANHHHIVHA